MRKSAGAIASQAATALTAAYASGWELEVDTGDLTRIAILLDFTWDSATSVEVLMAFSADGTTYYDPHEIASDGTISADEATLAVSASDTLAAEVVGGPRA